MKLRRLICIPKSAAEFRESFTVTPPVQPWPRTLTPKRLIALISRQQDADDALRIFEYASKYQRGFTHTFGTYSAITEKLCRARDFTSVETVLSQLLRSVIACPEQLFVSIIRYAGLAKKPSFSLKIYERIEEFGVTRSSRSLNALLNAFVRNKKYMLAHSTFRDCRIKYGIIPDVSTCNILLKAMCEMGDLDGALKLLDEMPSLGLVPNVVTYTTLLGGYSSCGDMDSARKTFKVLLDSGWTPDATAYTVLMYGYCKHGNLLEAIKVMDLMVENNILPNEITYGVIIEAYCKNKKSGEASNLLIDMLGKGYIPSPALCCKVVDSLCEASKAVDACSLYKKMLAHNCMLDETIVSTIVYWLCQEGRVWEARRMLAECTNGEGCSSLTYDTLIASMCEMGELVEAGRLWDEMVQKGISPSCFAYNCLIMGLCAKEKAAEAAEIMQEMVRKGMKVQKRTYAVLVGILTEQGLLQELDSLVISVAESGAVNSDLWDVMVKKLDGNVYEGVRKLEVFLMDN